MAAPKGNQFWKARSSHGRNPIYSNPDDLADAIEQYFKWVEENPFIEYKPMIEDKQITNALVPRPRPMLIGDCARFCGISEDTWERYRESEDFCGVIKEAETIIHNQKLAGAMSGFFKENIVARYLGIKDKHENENSGSISITWEK